MPLLSGIVGSLNIAIRRLNGEIERWRVFSERFFFLRDFERSESKIKRIRNFLDAVQILTILNVLRLVQNKTKLLHNNFQIDAVHRIIHAILDIHGGIFRYCSVFSDCSGGRRVHFS